MSARVPSARTYLVVTVVLLVLAGSTVGLATVHLGIWNTPIALGIAAIKALLIAVFFMELRDSFPLPRLAAVVALIWLTILIGFTMDDVLTRAWLPTPGK